MESFVLTDWLGVGKDIEEILKFWKNELRLKFHCYILIPRKCQHKTQFQHIVGGGRGGTENSLKSSPNQI